MRVAELNDLRKLGNFKKVLGVLEFDDEYLADTQKPNFDAFVKNSQKPAAFHTKIYFV